VALCIDCSCSHVAVALSGIARRGSACAGRRTKGTYVLCASLADDPAFSAWQPLPAVVWQVFLIRNWLLPSMALRCRLADGGLRALSFPSPSIHPRIDRRVCHHHDGGHLLLPRVAQGTILVGIWLEDMTDGKLRHLCRHTCERQPCCCRANFDRRRALTRHDRMGGGQSFGLPNH